jgi:hypothetical protein
MKQINAQYDELVSAVQALEKEVAKFRKLYEPQEVDLDQFVINLHDLLGELDAELELELS